MVEDLSSVILWFRLVGLIRDRPQHGNFQRYKLRIRRNLNRPFAGLGKIVGDGYYSNVIDWSIKGNRSNMSDSSNKGFLKEDLLGIHQALDA